MTFSEFILLYINFLYSLCRHEKLKHQEVHQKVEDTQLLSHNEEDSSDKIYNYQMLGYTMWNPNFKYDGCNKRS